MTERAIVDGNSAPGLPRHVRLKEDKQRGGWVILAPERVLMPDEISLEIIRRCDGETTVDAICGVLATEFNAPQDEIAKDVIDVLQDLADKGFLTV